ncbi:ATP-binding protein [Dactylosporangium matsuzakiense]|uniref:Histidine kinase/HSP90-like ATPase domain-containing protein n=1 Tax=Dactylosporangium matsuzakiense TaxID=53360 RepID=A0A9W6KRJ8_9ACTN|nr:ATP-binding protein [Dactylosporangium matsuzakiense]GLL05932.1 hypothetical protein GCM10017581_076800 [Dactylosporangium matsuzakiense]
MADDSAIGSHTPTVHARRRDNPQQRIRQLMWRPVDGGRVAVVGRARNWLSRSLPRLVGLNARIQLGEDTELLLSELITNAVLYAGGVTTVRLRLAGTVLRLTVCDHATATPTARAATTDDEHGRGIALVTALAARWGVERSRTIAGKCVWLELSTAAA